MRCLLQKAKSTDSYSVKPELGSRRSKTSIYHDENLPITSGHVCTIHPDSRRGGNRGQHDTAGARVCPAFQHRTHSTSVSVIVENSQGVKQTEMGWGFKSEWSNTLHINAQSERIHQTSAFKPLLGQRCLVPMDGFYEWKPDKSPVRFVRRDRSVFFVAGLWKAIEKQELDEPVKDFSSFCSPRRRFPAWPPSIRVCPLS